MQENISNQKDQIEEPTFILMSEQINKFKKPQLISKLDKRNVISTRT